MRRTSLALLLVLSAACRTEGDSSADRDDARQAAGDRAPAGLTAPDAVVRDYYEAISSGEYDRAYFSWLAGGNATGESLEQFRSRVSQMASVRIRTGQVDSSEPAAGTEHVRVPVMIRVSLRDGDERCMEGWYSLQRSPLPGVPASEQPWLIRSANLRNVELAICAAGLTAGTS